MDPLTDRNSSSSPYLHDNRFINRFWARVDTSGDCWEWQAYRMKSGYGQVGHNYKVLYAHRVAYELTNGPLASAEIVRQKCLNPSCCRPGHLLKANPTLEAQERIRAKLAEYERQAWASYEGDFYPLADLAYLAGIVDGEGYVSVYRGSRARGVGSFAVQLEVGQIDRRLTDWLQERFGGWTGTRQIHRGGRNKTFHRWTLNLRHRRRLCEALLPFLKIKRAEMELALEAMDLRTARGVPVSDEALRRCDEVIDRRREVRCQRSMGQYP